MAVYPPLLFLFPGIPYRNSAGLSLRVGVGNRAALFFALISKLFGYVIDRAAGVFFIRHRL